MKQYKDIKIGKQTRNKTNQSEIKRHYGFDTETLNGICKLICYSGMNSYDSLYFEEEKNPENLPDILGFLTKKKFSLSLNWFYNLDYDIRAIIRLMPEDNIAELYHNGNTEIYGYKIKFLSKKFFKISVNKMTFLYYDISQFFSGGLDKNAQIYLNSGKDERINSKILGSSRKYWKNNFDMVIEYCIQDCELTGKLGLFFYSNLWKVLKFNPKKPYSTGSISQEYFINNCDFIPTIKDIPEEILKIHQDNYRGGRIEVIKRGFFERINSYDLKSAYPAQMVNLMDYSAGKWIKSTDFDDEKQGIYKVKLNWFNEHLGFSAFNAVGKTLYPNIESGICWLNERELMLLNDYSRYGDYEIIDGYTFHPFREVYPYKDLIYKFFELKETTEDKNEKMLYKLFINSIYGKTAQAIYDKKEGKYLTGKLYNPVYSCRITANTRADLLRHALPYSDKIIGFMTDSIQTTAEIKGLGNNLGDLAYEYTANEGVILMAGVRYLDERQKMRGFSNNYKLKNLLKNNPEKDKIPVNIEKPVTIFQGLNYKKYTKEDINVFMTEEKILDINGDNRRLWKDNFLNAEDCFNRNIDSMPLFFENIAGAGLD